MPSLMDQLSVPKLTLNDILRNQYTAAPPEYPDGYKTKAQQNESVLNYLLAAAGVAGDWAQTRNLTSDGIHYEANMMLGKHPNREAVDGYFAGTLLLHALANSPLGDRFLTPTQQDVLNKAMTIERGSAMVHNTRQGIPSTF